MVQILFDCKLSLGSSLASSFQFHSGIPMSVVLGESLFYKLCDCFGSVFSWHIFKKWKRLDPHGLVPKWFDISVAFLVALHFSPSASAGIGPLDICGSNDFVSVCNRLFWVSADSLFIYIDGSLKNLGTVSCRAGAAVFFKNINLGLGVSVQSLMSFTLMELQAIALALECVPVACSVHLFLDSQAALDACRSESDLVCPDFCNQCWVKCRHIKNYLPPCVDEHFLLADGSIVSGNFRHFVRDVFYAVCQMHWEVGSGSGFLDSDLHSNVDWLCSSKVWHPDLHMTTGFTSRLTAEARTYLIKTLYCQLSIAIWKCIYNKYYPSVLYLYCDKVEVSDHVFSCMVDDSVCYQVLSGLFLSSSGVLQLLSNCVLNLLIFLAFYKGFEAISVFHDSKVAGVKISDFVQSICLAFRNKIWLVYARHHAFMKKNGLIPVDGSIFILVSGLVSGFSAGVIKLLGVAEAFGVRFGFCKSCSFFSGIGDLVFVNISV
ncbi:hypothetical protein G9A89_022827 [Geosiphon pyriformis]|nr:hypothetical protein G9A89_022827 [Geosiphon pyriformis]